MVGLFEARQPWWWELRCSWAEPVTLVRASYHGRVVGVGGWCLMISGCGATFYEGRAKTLPHVAGPTEVVSMDIVIFLKSLLSLLCVLRGALDEKLDPLDRVVAAFRCRILLEGIALRLKDG